MKNKVFIGLVVIAGLAFFLKGKYARWSNTAHYYARLNYDAHDVLEEIQLLQSKYHRKNQTYASSITELVKSFEDASRRLKENPSHYPGLTREKSFTGSAYFYFIVDSSADEFVAQAKYRGFVENGDDIWQIKKEGKPFAIVTSKYYKKK